MIKQLNSVLSCKSKVLWKFHGDVDFWKFLKKCLKKEFFLVVAKTETSATLDQRELYLIGVR